MSIKAQRFDIICPHCGTLRSVGYRRWRAAPKAPCRACARPKLPKRTTVACVDCGKVREVDTLEVRKGRRERCYSCAAKLRAAARRPAKLRAEEKHPLRCPDCLRTRLVHYRHWLRVRRSGGTAQCSYCRLAQFVGRRGLHPMPEQPRRLSFDLASAVADFNARGGRIEKCPTADLREPEPLQAPIPSGYA